MHSIHSFKVLPDYKLLIQFEDGLQKIVALSETLNKGVAAELKDYSLFSKVFIEDGGGLQWPNGFDICPVTLREMV